MSLKAPSSLPTKYATFAVTVPDHEEWRTRLWGALWEPCSELAHEEDTTTVTAEEAAEVFRAIYSSKRRAQVVPIGGTIIWPASVAIPAGYFECNGQQLNKNDYPLLWGVIGYTWGGSGDMFNLPNLTDRAPVGSSVAHPVGDRYGEGSVTLTVQQIPAHTHSYNKFDSSIGLAGEIPSDGVVAALGGQTGSTGGGGSHNNIPPSAAVRFIIAAT